MPLITQAALMGGNVRVGLEDSLTVGPGRLATSNAEQVRMIRGVLETLGLAIATPEEARQMRRADQPCSPRCSSMQMATLDATRPCC